MITFCKCFIFICVVFGLGDVTTGRLRPRMQMANVRGNSVPAEINAGSLGESEIGGNEVELESCPYTPSFMCDDRLACIDEVYECDNFTDCSDGSDEKETCQYFDCGDGNYLSYRFVCDGQFDCPNSYDEDESHGHCKIARCADDGVMQEARGPRVCDGVPDCQDRYNSDECNCSFTFVCDNMRCIHNNHRCDGDDNCGDNSDEQHCPTFICDNGNTFLEGRLCDGVDGCGDSSDECNCSDSFFCANNRCTLNHFKCDGSDNCGDASDECECPNTFVCGNGRCIRDYLVGNDVDDCWDNSDEIVPTTTTPYVTMTSSIRETSQAVNAIKTMTSQKMRSFYKCKNNKTISSELLCNGNDDCGDVSASDECECTDTIYCLNSGKCTINASTCEENTKKCDLDSEFRCSNGDCLPKNVLCDKVVNCSDKSDEMGCGYTYCSSNGIEISVDQICNGVMDCPDNSDECECDGNTFKCNNGKCIQASEICTGYDACGDCSAERKCQINESSEVVHPVFNCDDGSCIRESLRCQEKSFCSNGEDLFNCPSTPTTTTTSRNTVAQTPVRESVHGLMQTTDSSTQRTVAGDGGSANTVRSVNMGIFVVAQVCLAYLMVS